MYGLFIILNSNTYLSEIPINGQKFLYITILTGTFLIPIAFIPLFLYQGIITGIQMSERKERSLPLLITSLLLGFTQFSISSFLIAIKKSSQLSINFIIFQIKDFF